MSMGQVTEAITGGETPTVALADQIGKAVADLEAHTEAMKEAKDNDNARFAELKAQVAADADVLTQLREAEDARIRDQELKDAIETARAWKEELGKTRSPSKGHLIGAGSSEPNAEAGAFIGSVGKAFHRRPANEQAEGRSVLESLTNFSEAVGKSTLGTTDALGGWVIPNAQVAEFIKPAAVRNIYRDLMTVIDGVRGSAVDLPFRAASPNRAVVASFGSTKENVDLAYNGYTVTMYTLARIYDIGNQFLRQSAGAAEADVLQELGTAFALGEAYYIREGTGSSEPFGYTPALTNGPASFRSTFSSPSDTTVAGSIAASIAVAAGDLEARGENATAAVLAGAAYWQMVRQGSDTAGFWFTTAAQGIEGIRPQTLISPFGIPVYADKAASKQGTAAVIDNLVVADWKAFKVFFGQDYRVDSSDEAGTRWDTNLTGFRGEEEMGFDARPAVYAGKAQMITDIIP